MSVEIHFPSVIEFTGTLVHTGVLPAAAIAVGVVVGLGALAVIAVWSWRLSMQLREARKPVVIVR